MYHNANKHLQKEAAIFVILLIQLGLCISGKVMYFLWAFFKITE